MLMFQWGQAGQLLMHGRAGQIPKLVECRLGQVVVFHSLIFIQRLSKTVKRPRTGALLEILKMVSLFGIWTVIITHLFDAAVRLA